MKYDATLHVMRRSFLIGRTTGRRLTVVSCFARQLDEAIAAARADRDRMVHQRPVYWISKAGDDARRRRR